MTEPTDEEAARVLQNDGRHCGPAMASRLSRALLDARAENARLRADAQAAVAVIVERAMKAANDEAEYQASVAKNQDANGIDWRATDWASRKLREVEAAIRDLADADALAVVEALRKERDDALELAEERLRGQHRLSNQLNDTVRDLNAELAASEAARKLDQERLAALIRRAHDAIIRDEKDGAVWAQLLADMAKEIDNG